MNVVRDFLATLYKMFAADLVMTIAAVAVVVICGLARSAIGTVALPYVLATGVTLALIIAVLRAARR